MGLPYGEEIMMVGRTMWTQSTSVTDGRTDRQTDRQTELRSQRPYNAERRTVKTRGMGLLYGENCVILTSTVLTDPPV